MNRVVKGVTESGTKAMDTSLLVLVVLLLFVAAVCTMVNRAFVRGVVPTVVHVCQRASRM